ncbi:SDR family oxidoreductase [Croceicoccus sp. F390]|uniref:SDR family oxidoreductase n=1 Tax=Croceicoccus esteveae TaxID=3075597 RepID=A0ABU2ZID4_9SPHN|nr:SDR family NAD(P)-dependent oxidoreductase [Croceicoccus sp. F390]MDT0576121.1 SDR family oxidoreductase [Croceicoccus sp. F390]
MKITADTAAIVTGGASGLGAATAHALAAKGARVALFDRDRERGEAVARDIGGLFCDTDVTDSASLESAFARSRQHQGQESVLICCAGIVVAQKTASRSREDDTIRHFDFEAFQRTIDINLVGTFRCIALAAAGMMHHAAADGGERGAIITTASVAAEDGQIGQAAYTASKAGVLGMTLPIARDLMNEGIRINTILPGIFSTPMMASMPDKVQDALAASVPFPKRLGDPAEYAAMAISLVENSYVNGTSIRLDGGIRMAPR